MKPQPKLACIYLYVLSIEIADNVIFNQYIIQSNNPAHANILIHRFIRFATPSAAAAVPSLTHPNPVQASLSYYDLCVIYEPYAAAVFAPRSVFGIPGQTGWLHFLAAPNK